jgi:hypothetical protein
MRGFGLEALPGTDSAGGMANVMSGAGDWSNTAYWRGFIDFSLYEEMMGDKHPAVVCSKIHADTLPLGKCMASFGIWGRLALEVGP